MTQDEKKKWIEDHTENINKLAYDAWMHSSKATKKDNVIYAALLKIMGLATEINMVL